MPESQENEWQPLGFTSDDFIRTSEDWDEIVEYFRQAANSYRTLYLAFDQTSESFQSFANMLESPAEDTVIVIRQGEYPCHDGYGTYWYDNSGFHSDDDGVCFICERPTARMDIDLHSYFCNSTECNNKLREQLENDA